MISHGPFCPIIFATCRREGLQCYTYRGVLTAQPPGITVDTIVHSEDLSDFHHRFVSTACRRPATTHYSAHG